MRKFLSKLTLTLPVLLVVMLVNYFVDPANLFNKGKYERGVAGILSQGKYATNVTNYDGRLLQKYTIELLNHKPDVLVLSSSRGQFIGADMFPGKKFFNAWVQSAAIEDFLAIYDVCEQQAFKPKEVILTLDPRMLNENSPHKMWHLVSEHYYSMLRKLNIAYRDSIKPDEFNAGTVSQLLSLSYFQSALKNLYMKQTSYSPSDSLYNKGDTRAPDGIMSYGKKRREVSVLEVRKKATEYVEDPVTLEKNFDKVTFDKISAENLNTLTRFVDYLKAKGVKVTFFLSPFNPVVYDYFKTEPSYQKVIETEGVYRELADKTGSACIGSLDPAGNQLDESYFYDGIHCNEACVRLIFNKEYKH
ncbi:hypothetical protein IM792_01625 [Mucilaginibacter sp. JRF]|uniref:hypothetical protein n=1 Tax=Mucilaginibacter sp. JRF TaxID=2780088 RepID=UPI0018813CEB|nr:hypothetical protein [Mucilaginibacter sp. JRF]MBE9583139.1 hypothetical protein [Mucilaginibacter sp. JRF]